MSKSLTLHKLHLENFKGIKAAAINFGSPHTTITAENGIGKTTIYDAFLWLLFGKDSTGRKDFQVRPLDKQNNPIPGIVLAVEAHIGIGGDVVVVRKEQHENNVKGQLRGYTTKYTVDDVPQKQSEYQDWIEQLVSEDVFRMLTDVTYFNSQLHWTQRRAMLLQIAGEIGEPAGFEELLSRMGRRTLDEYKTVLAAEKKAYEKERDEIGPRIDELQRGLAAYAATAEDKDLAGEREKITAEIARLREQRTSLLAQEKQRQQQLDKINSLASQQAMRESLLQNDTSGYQHLITEKQQLQQNINKLQTEVYETENKLRDAERVREIALEDKATAQQRIDRAKAEYQTEVAAHKERVATREAAIANTDPVCPTCKQPLPAEQIDRIKASELNDLAKSEAMHKAYLAQISERGKQAKNELEAAERLIEARTATVAELQPHVDSKRQSLADFKAKAEARTVEINKLIDSQEPTKPENDPLWCDLDKQIAELKAQVGAPASEQLSQIEENIDNAGSAIEKINNALAQADRSKQDAQRICELSTREMVLGQMIADVERLLAMIGEYKVKQSELLTEAVNGMFKYVEFQLFRELLNGSIEETCEAMLNGVPSSDLSTGQKIIVGVDIINVLARHYGLSIPLFVDNAESLTLPLEATSQTIRLVARDGVSELKVA